MTCSDRDDCAGGFGSQHRHGTRHVQSFVATFTALAVSSSLGSAKSAPSVQLTHPALIMWKIRYHPTRFMCGDCRLCR
jgi:hypothetical protein